MGAFGVVDLPPVINANVVPLDPTGLLEALAQCRREDLRFRIVFGQPHHDAYASYTFALLSARQYRPCDRTAKRRDKLPPSHWITSRVVGSLLPKDWLGPVRPGECGSRC